MSQRMFLPCLVLLALLSSFIPIVTGSYNCSNNATQNSYLWRIETTPPVYLFGTMHVPYKKIWSGIPDNVKSILSLSKHLCVELRLTDPETQRNLSACRYLPKNETLKTVLPKELYIRVLRYLIQVQELFPNWLFGKGGVDGFSKVQSDRLFYSMIGDYENLRPVWLLMLLSSLSRENVQERNIPLLDVFLDRAADGVGKSVEAIEVYKEQCRPFNKLNETKVLVALRKQLDYLEPLAYTSDGPISSTDSDLETYNCGDFHSLVETTPILPIPSISNISNLTSEEAKDLQDINDYLTNQLVYRRNRRMSRKIESLLKSTRNETYLFALGAGHFLGERSVIHMLHRKGYKVVRVSSTELIPGPPLPSNFVSLGDPSSQPGILNVSRNFGTTAPGSQGQTPPTLSPETISEIIETVFNKSMSLYKVDSVEVSPTPSSKSTPTTPTPTSSASPVVMTMKTRMIAKGDVREESEDKARTDIPSGSSRLRYSLVLIFLAIIFALALL